MLAWKCTQRQWIVKRKWGCFTSTPKFFVTFQTSCRKLHTWGHCGVYVYDCVCVWALLAAWQCRGLEMQQGATADTETLRPAGSNPFWTSPGTSVGPYVWEHTSTLLCYFKGQRDENILPASGPLQSDHSSSHPANSDEESQKKKKKNTLIPIAQSVPLCTGETRKVNYIKQTYAILIPLKFWITALINHSLIWALKL